jgi:hypothetical protein
MLEMSLDDLPSANPEMMWSCPKFTRAFGCLHLWQAADSASSLNLVPRLPNMNYATHRPDFAAGARDRNWSTAEAIESPSEFRLSTNT